MSSTARPRRDHDGQPAPAHEDAGELLPHLVAALRRVQAREALGRGGGAVGIALGHAAEELHGLGLEAVGHARAGQALVAALQRLPCSIVWVDSRPGLWPDSAVADACTTLVQSDPVQDAVADLPAGSRVVILTHSHVEDWDISAACLARQREAGDLPFVGLIGSASKWASFRRRLLERGFDAAAVDAVQCPVGIPGIAGKEPEVIAVAIAAQLMQTRALEPS